jgi:hypothetical protein
MYVYSLPAMEGYYAKQQSLKHWLHAEAGSLFMQTFLSPTIALLIKLNSNTSWQLL